MSETRISKVCIFLTAISLSVVVIWLTSHQVPVLDGDSAWFLPVSINQASGVGFYNYWFPKSDPEGQFRLVWHGFMAPLVEGTILPTPTYAALYILRGIWLSIVLLTTAWLMTRIIDGRGERQVMLPTVAAMAMLTGLVTTHITGRPEAFATLTMLLVLSVAFVIPRRFHWLALGLGLGFVACAQPGIALLAALMVTVYFGCISPDKENSSAVSSLIEVTKTATIAILTVVVAATTLHPFGLMDWIEGLRHHGQLVLGYWNVSAFYHWFLWPQNFGYGVWYLMILGALLVQAIRNRRNLSSPIQVGLFTVLVLGLGWRLGVWVSSRNYNLIAFSPMVCMGLLWLFPLTNRDGSGQRQSSWWRTVYPVFFLLLCAIPVVGSARFFAHAFASIPNEVSFNDARQRLEELLKDESLSVSVSGAFYALSEDQTRMGLVSSIERKDSLKDADVLMLQQAYSGLLKPPKIAGFRLIEDRFADQSPKLFGVRTGSVPLHYGFAVYQRETLADAK